jgi:CheY-like chemotaxis protein
MTTVPFPILLVEDDPNDVLLVQRAFRKCNIVNHFNVVGEGEQAVSYLAGQGSYSNRLQFPLPGLMLLDLKLPRKSGLEVPDWVRQQPGLKRLPVVILTSSKQSFDINRAYDLGANSYLVKPVGFADLQQMVSTLNLYWVRLNENPEVNRS